MYADLPPFGCTPQAEGVELQPFSRKTSVFLGISLITDDQACSAQVRFLASTDVESRSAHFSLQRLGREELLFLLKEVSCAGERDRQLWKVYSKKAHQMVASCSVEELCDIVRALCRVHYHRWSLLNAVKRRMRSREIQSLSPRRFTQLLSDLRRLNFVDGPMLQDVLKHWQFEEKIQELDAFDLCLLLIAFARCSMREEERVSTISQALRQKSSDLTASTAAGSLYAMALLDYQDDTAFFLAAKALPRCLGHASQQELVNIAFALVVLDLPAAELFSFVLERLALQADTLEPVAVHALRIVAHAVKFPEALRPAMRNSLEVPEIKGRSVKALQEARVLLGAGKDAAHGHSVRNHQLQTPTCHRAVFQGAAGSTSARAGGWALCSRFHSAQEDRRRGRWLHALLCLFSASHGQVRAEATNLQRLGMGGGELAALQMVADESPGEVGLLGRADRDGWGGTYHSDPKDPLGRLLHFQEKIREGLEALVPLVAFHDSECLKPVEHESSSIKVCVG
ncbi:unnamed protein product [Durusdinium trenchii]|uniref:RNA-editing substrate-binding complex 8 protein HEAT repeats domain-containing protein n=1 Tax=Durusdinium trenchii TaxID=1381693 RepID=A0ABP0PYE9_9DINO